MAADAPVGSGNGFASMVLFWGAAGISSRWPHFGQATFRPAPWSGAFSTLPQAAQAK